MQALFDVMVSVCDYVTIMAWRHVWLGVKAQESYSPTRMVNAPLLSAVVVAIAARLPQGWFPRATTGTRSSIHHLCR
jgi:hypothetical protein